MANPVTRIIITAVDKASSVFDKIRSKAGVLSTALVGYFSARMFGGIVDQAAEFEASMSRVQAASQASADEMQLLRAAAEEAGATTKYTATEAAGALEEITKAGVDAAGAVATLPAVLNLASAGGIELGAAASYIVQAVNGMGLAFTDAGRVADVLAQGANASMTSVEGLGQALSYAAPSATALGLSLETTVAIIGKFADAGIDASRAGTSLNSILSQFINPASAFRKELAAAGITTTNFEQALTQLAAAGSRGEKAIIAVGQEAGPALRGLLNQGIGALNELKTALQNSAGSAATFAQTMDDNLRGAGENFRSVWDALLLKLGTPVLEPLKEQINSLADRLRGFVADGTATAFGEAIADAVRSAGKWLQSFLSSIDFTAAGQRMQTFAADMGAIFTRIGEHATAVGGAVQTLYGGLVFGANTVQLVWDGVLAGLYKVQEAVFTTAAAVNQALSRITFGDMSANFEQWAADAEAWADRSAQAARQHATAAVDAAESVNRGLSHAADGWQALTDRATKSGEASAAAAQKTDAALADVAEQSKVTAAEIQRLERALIEAMNAGDVDAVNAAYAELQAAIQAAGGDVENLGTTQRQEIAATVSELEKLRAEYSQAVDERNWQRAAELQQEIQRQLKETGDTAKTTAEEVSAAYEALGVQSQAELDRLAAKAKAAFDLIRQSGQATPRELQQAFKAYAEAAINANDGVATAAIKAEAAQRGLKIEADEAGKTVVKRMEEAAAAIKKVADNSDSAAQSLSQVANEVSNLETEASDHDDSIVSITQSWITAEVAASSYADGAAKAGRRAFEMYRSLEKARAAAKGYVAMMEDLDAQQQRMSSNGVRGLEDLQQRWLELNGTEAEVAKARQQRERLQYEREIASLQLAAKRATAEGNTAEAFRLNDEVKLARDQIVLLDKIHAKEEANRLAAAKERKEAEREREREERNTNRRERNSAAEVQPTTASTQPAPGAAPAGLQVDRVVQVNLNLGTRTHSVYAAPNVADALLRDLETASRVSA